jgi:hypothetical protein
MIKRRLILLFVLGLGSALHAQTTGYATTTWVPVLSSGAGTLPTFSTNSGTYTQVGRLVFFNVFLNNTSGGTAGAGANQLSISLPFATGAVQLPVRVPLGSSLNGTNEDVIFGTYPTGVGTTMLLWRLTITAGEPELVAYTNADLNHADTRQVALMGKILR